jgi:Glycerol-3-phosphate responsive antiterminator (mRNA-binding)
MSAHSRIGDLFSLSQVVPLIDSYTQFASLLKQSGSAGMLMLYRCNVLELGLLSDQAQRKGYSVYVNIDHISGVHADPAGIRYLIDTVHVAGIESTNVKVLALAKVAQLATVLHVYAADSTGLASALDAADPQIVDLLDISPALAIPYIYPPLSHALPLPFIGSGLISTATQVQSILGAGALGVLVAQTDFTSSSIDM